MKILFKSKFWYLLPLLTLLVVAILNEARTGYLFFFLSMIPPTLGWINNSKVKKM